MKIIEPTPPQSSDFFQSVWKRQTWLNVIYLLLSFPLGLVYFIFLITGLSLGFGLLITLFGIVILMGVLWMVHAFNKLEIAITNEILGFHVISKPFKTEETGFWKKFKALFKSATTWKGLVYQLLRFPLGIFSFSLVIGLLSASFGLIATPFIFRTHWFNMDLGPHYSRWVIDTVPEALLCFGIGVVLLYVSLFIFNWLAWMYGKLAKTVLSD